MYANKLVAAIKVDDRVLREFNDVVYLPFGKEYSIYLKNLGTTECKINISIDGKLITESALILSPGDSTNIERAVNNKGSGNKFKFIERSTAIETHRGIKPEDGFVHITYEFERQYSQQTLVSTTEINPSSGWNPHPNVAPTRDFNWLTAYGSLGGSTASQPLNSGTTYSYTTSASASASATSNQVNLNNLSSFNAGAVNSAGITAPGSKSNQTFVPAYFGISDGIKHSLVIKLLGDVGDAPVVEPVTTKKKQKCEFCGKVNKMSSKFCSECGAGLEIF